MLGKFLNVIKFKSCRCAIFLINKSTSWSCRRLFISKCHFFIFDKTNTKLFCYYCDIYSFGIFVGLKSITHSSWEKNCAFIFYQDNTVCFFYWYLTCMYMHSPVLSFVSSCFIIHHKLFYLIFLVKVNYYQ